MKPLARKGGGKHWWRGGAVDENSDASRMKRGWRRQTAKVEVSTGFAKPSNTSGTKACTGVANTGRTKGERTTKLQNGGDQQRRSRRQLRRRTAREKKPMQLAVVGVDEVGEVETTVVATRSC